MATVRTIAGCIALVSIVVAPAHWGPADRVLLASTPPPALVLNLRFTTTQTLPPASAAALMAEATSIWKEGHILLRWMSADAVVEESAEDNPSYLRVLVMARVVPAAGVQSPWAVGELVRMQGARSLAIASITGARRVVEEARRFQVGELQAVHDHRLGVVLGRAVAHEIGHYLLRTNTHATQGLMRASIDAHEFADPRSRTFRLDQAAQAHLAQLAAGGALSPQSTTGPFSYPAR